MAKLLKIFVDAHRFEQGYDGVRTFIKGIYSNLYLSDNTLIYFGTGDVANLQKEFPGIPEERIIQYKYKNTLVRLGFEIPRILRKFKFDYAHFQYVSPIIKFCKYIVTTHDMLIKDFSHEFPLSYRLSRLALFKRSLKKADIKTVPSIYSRDRVSFHYNISPGELLIVPNGVDKLFFSTRGNKKEEAINHIREKYNVENYILNVSRVEPRKNQEILLEAYLDMQLHRQGFSVVFIGKESIKNSLFKRLLNKVPENIKSKIRHIQQVSAGDLMRFYRAARIFVYPSKAEGFGLPPLEAAALGIPVLCSNTTAMSEYAFFEGNLFNPADMAEFQQKLACLLSGGYDETELEKISSIIRNRYSWETIAQNLAFYMRC